MSYAPKIFSGIFAVATLTTALVACNNTSPQNPANNLAAQEAMKEDYTQTTTLNLVQTGAPLASVKSNQVHLIGEGTNSTYTIQYHFNSGAFTAFRILQINKAVHHSADGGAVADAQASLINGATVTPIKTRMTVPLTANTNYILQIVHPQNYGIFDLTLDVLAWAGDASVISPDVARTCQTTLGPMVFLAEDSNNVSGYLTTPAKSLYLSPGKFCGNEFQADDSTCHVSRLSPAATFPDVETCSAGHAPNQASFELQFTQGRSNPHLLCRNNGMAGTALALTACQDSVLDTSVYEQVNDQ